MTRRRSSSPAARYQSVLRSIRARHTTATYRDAQFVYRILKAKTGGAVLTPAMIKTSRRGTTARALTEARNRGSRSVKLTPADAGKLTKERNRGKAKEKKTGGTRGGEAAGGAPETAGGSSSGAGGASADEDEDEDEGGDDEDAPADLSPDAWDDWDGDFEDFEYETSADYGDE